MIYFIVRTLNHQTRLLVYLVILNTANGILKSYYETLKGS
jgi:hypothetical protein